MSFRVALISFEFPPSVAIGGIGAYAWEAARMLSSAGCDVTVFAAGNACNEPAEQFNVRVCRVESNNRSEFRKKIHPIFTKLHKETPFDVLESPEIGAEGAVVAECNPEIARVVKLHTPTYLISRITYEKPTLAEQTRFILGALRRFRFDRLSEKPYDPETDEECKWTQSADVIAAPCSSIAKIISMDWALSNEKIGVYGLPYLPSKDLVSLSFPTQANTVGFLGRLEPRKGIVELVHAIPRILEQAPRTQFRFLGPSWPYKKSDMETWIRKRYSKYMSAITFVGAVSREKLALELAKCDIMVLPSRWENFPFACWESMASGRLVIGSRAGGMADVIEHNKSGLLLDPYDSNAVSESVLSVLGDIGKIREFALAGRERVSDVLSPAKILPIQLNSYRKAMDNAKRRQLNRM